MDGLAQMELSGFGAAAPIFKGKNALSFRECIPIGSMYGIFTYIYHKNQPNVGKYTIHGWYGIYYITWGNCLFSTLQKKIYCWWLKSCTTCGCIKPCKEWDIYHLNWLAGFLNHQQYHYCMCPRFRQKNESLFTITVKESAGSFL